MDVRSFTRHSSLVTCHLSLVMPFADIIGQDNAVSVLRRAIQHQRLHHAYLFSGYDGVGKKFTALTLAKALNCKELPDDACDRCTSCHKINEGIHPDVHVIEPDGQFIKIDQIRFGLTKLN